jgi:phthiodiolone/phenolphthiodiolone dimycocerosates ketoreductase
MTMANRPTETAMYCWNHRSISPKAVGPFVQQIEASGVVDHFWMWDVVAGWFPPPVWTTDFTPLAALGDFDSVYDAFVTLGLAAASTDKLGMLLGGTNSLRHGPAELMQMSMTLADATEGGMICCIGAGEAYNTTPFGYSRKLSVSRLEDELRILRLLWECEGPIDYDGRVIKFDQAYIGTVRGRRPEFWGMGTGPRLQRITAQYGDGWMTNSTNAWTTPELFAEKVKETRTIVEQNGRDPDAFRFGLTPVLLLHEDPDVIDRVHDNPVIRYFSALFGRLDNADWAKEGIESPFPPDYKYSLEYLPMKWTKSDVMKILDRTPRVVSEKSWLSGSPKEVAAKLQEYVEAGADLICPYDFLPAGLSDLSEAPASFERQLELCRLLKSYNASPETQGSVNV